MGPERLGLEAGAFLELLHARIARPSLPLAVQGALPSSVDLMFNETLFAAEFVQGALPGCGPASA